MFGQRNSSIRVLLFALMLLVFLPVLMLWSVFGVNVQFFKQERDANEQENFFDMSLEELMEIPVVVTASGQGPIIDELLAPVGRFIFEDVGSGVVDGHRFQRTGRSRREELC